ncbi:GNAT family N-acetyltransferase [Nocardia sp. NBC_00416]|uniref:GNAT family N-acetyltransferase n=1 Tax=Nocardia sp. NBC_00416 TaxID=2975991 RepID=UPI002E1DB10C
MTTADPVVFHHCTAARARELHATVEAVYLGSYVEAIVGGDPFDTPAEFMRRFDVYTGPTRGAGFELVIARVAGAPVGQTWGWPLTPDTGWWRGFQPDEGVDPEFTAETGARTFALSEIMVCAEHTGRGLARALHDELLRGRAESRATLLVDPENERAYRAYQNWGWSRVGTLRPSWQGAPTFDVLIRDLPRHGGPG